MHPLKGNSTFAVHLLDALFPRAGAGRQGERRKIPASQDSGNKMPACQKRWQREREREVWASPCLFHKPDSGYPAVGVTGTWKSGKELRQSLISSVPIDGYMETKVTSSSSAHLVEFLIHIFFLNSIAINHTDKIYHQSLINILTHCVLFSPEGWNYSRLLLVDFCSCFTSAQQRD